MRKLAIAMALASTAIATPAIAKDGAWYAGVEGGLMVAEDTHFDVTDAAGQTFDEALIMNHKMGFDVDVLGGYDLGMFRLEAELAYKHATLKDSNVDIHLSGSATDLLFDTSGHLSILTVMGNALLDFGDDSGWSGYVGPGIGLASVKYNPDIATSPVIDFSDTDSRIGWQAIAGVRYAISPTMDLGLKYRFLSAGKVRLSDDNGLNGFDAKGSVHTHSLLLSLLWNFGGNPPPPPPPPPAPPPPPPPPATQTCPDGSVILATDACPPPPPPPPPPPVERGERGQ